VRRLKRCDLALVILTDSLKKVADKPLNVIDFRHFGQGKGSWHFCAGERKVKRKPVTSYIQAFRDAI
jgi:hypothetical protein